MFFASDNGAGASTKILTAVTEAMSGGPALAYGNDAQTKRVEQLFNEVFEREVAVFMLTSGTATNALSIAHVAPPWGAVYLHEAAHSNATECGAPEFYSAAKLIGLPGVAGKISPDAIEARIRGTRIGDPHASQPAAISLTNLTECGTLYSTADVGAIAEVAKRHKLALHMDGARFASALAASGASPAEMTWRAGVDILSLGATKMGAIAAEAVVIFDPAKVDGFLYRRMRGGHLLSKMRFVSAQFEAWLGEAHYLDLARHANAMAKRLGAGLEGLGIRLAWPVEGNEVFPRLDRGLADALRGHFAFHGGPPEALPKDQPLGPNEVIARFIPSFRTTEAEVDELIGLVRGLLRPSLAAE